MGFQENFWRQAIDSCSDRSSVSKYVRKECLQKLTKYHRMCQDAFSKVVGRPRGDRGTSLFSPFIVSLILPDHVSPGRDKGIPLSRR